MTNEILHCEVFFVCDINIFPSPTHDGGRVDQSVQRPGAAGDAGRQFSGPFRGGVEDRLIIQKAAVGEGFGQLDQFREEVYFRFRIQPVSLCEGEETLERKGRVSRFSFL